MKTQMFYLTLLGVIFQINFLLATPSISNFTTSPPNNNGFYDLYVKFEITFTMNNYSLPYDPNVINSYGEFWSPSGKYYKVYAFYYKDYTKTDIDCSSDPDEEFPYQCEILTPNGISNWKIRFTPNEEGNWQYRIVAIDASGSITYPSGNTEIFTCEPSSYNGFIEKANNKFLHRTTGEFFFPVGQNVAWYGTPYPSDYGCTQTYGTNEYQYYIDNAAINNSNYIRIWLDNYEGIALVGKDFTTQQLYSVDLYNQKDAYQLDLIINYAKTKGVNIMLCLFNAGSWGDGSDGYPSGYNHWTDENPFNQNNNGGFLVSPYNFFSDPTAKAKTKNLLKYIVSRWGYATNLVAWELWNEFNEFVNVNSHLFEAPPPTFESDLLTWHQDMFIYIKSIDPYKHLITTSVSGGLASSNLSIFSAMDFAQSHLYKRPDLPNHQYDDFQNDLFEQTYPPIHEELSIINKPILTGEWGFVDHPEIWCTYDPKGLELHNTLWSSAFSTALGSASNWWWDSYIKPNYLFNRYKPISVFMNSLPTPSDLFNSARIGYNVNGTGLRTYYMHNSNYDTIYGWTQDTNFHCQKLSRDAIGNQYLITLNPDDRPCPYSSNNEIVIDVNPIQNNKIYIVKWYGSETGMLFETNTVISSNNSIKIYIPQALRTSTFGDAVFAIYLDCDRYLWKEGVLSNNTYQNVSGNIVCNKTTGQVFYKTFDGKIHSMWWDENSNTWQWSELNSMGNNVAGDLAISQDGSQVFYRTTDNKLNSIWYNTSIPDWQWSDLNQVENGNVKGPIAVGPNGEVFYRTLSYKLNKIWRNPTNNTWQRTDLNNASSNNVGDAMAVSSNCQVFYKTLDNKLNNIWFNTRTNLWNRSELNNAANGNVCGNITITPNGQVFYRTCTYKINNIWWDPSTKIWNWSGLDNAANYVAGDLMADNVGKVFYRNTNSNINCIYWDNTWHWSELDNSTSNNVYPGNIATDNSGNVFFRGNDNLVHRLYYNSQCYYIPSTNFRENTLFDTSLFDNTYNDKIDGNNSILIYPNPTNNKINISSKELITIINIYSFDGRLMNETNNLNVSEAVIDVSGINDGIYFIKVYLATGQIINSKIIINH